jgi:hypothetical protein
MRRNEGNTGVGSLQPGLRPLVTRFTPGLGLDTLVGVQTLVSKVAALHQRFSATPSVIGTQLRKAQMIALTLAPLSVAATAPAWCSVEVEV